MLAHASSSKVYQPRYISNSSVVQRVALAFPAARPTNHFNEFPLDISSRFGRRIRQLRRERQLTQEQVAKRFGIDRSYISEIERGRKSISLVMLEILALGFTMSLSEIVTDI